MAKYDDLPVYKASYDLLIEIFHFTKEFTKEYKYTIGESLKKETVELITLIYRANSKRDKFDVFHSDRGSQYASYAFRRLLANNRIRQSMSGKGNCYDKFQSLFYLPD